MECEPSPSIASSFADRVSGYSGPSCPPIPVHRAQFDSLTGITGQDTGISGHDTGMAGHDTGAAS